jgi:hypothetical protein
MANNSIEEELRLTATFHSMAIDWPDLNWEVE